MREHFGQFKIDDAESPQIPVVGDIARERIVVDHAIPLLQFLEERRRLGFADRILRWLGTVRGHQGQRVGITIDQARDVFAPTIFKHLQHPHLIRETLVGASPAKGLVHTTIIADPDFRAQPVFSDSHAPMLGNPRANATPSISATRCAPHS